ncbi:BspA family leucine-rich repeat surface protein [Flagellimonas flava]|uniref:BspA family leucine-rich repeat surface protein n=1 Tax=Flagellimonas flava TaxID=570519 RepID=UPI003D65F806
MKLKNLCALALFALAALACSKDDDKTTPEANAPTITGHTESGPVGSTLIINGTDFGATISDNTVTLSGVSVTLSDANTTKLTGTVPAGAETGKIKVTTEGGTATSAEDFEVTVEETNQAPTITEGQSFSVKEDIDDTFVIGTVEATDNDGDPLTFSIADEISPFEITENGTLSLIPSKTLDYETATEHIVTIEVGDGTDTVQETITIVIENVPDAPYALDKTSFVLEFTTTMADQEIGVGTDFFNDGYDYLIDWGDGSPVEHIINSTEPTHIYADEGTHSVAINGSFPRVTFNDRPWATNLTGILNWGTIEWETFADAFFGCTELENYTATDAPDLSNVTDMTNMFRDAQSFNGDLSNWDVSKITNMGYMFSGASSFNGDIGNWVVSSVYAMNDMFRFTNDFDKNLGSWNIQNVESMVNMFSHSGLSSDNYGKTLIGWANLEGVPDNIVLGAHLLGYCGTDAVAARNILTDSNGLNWDIQGDIQCD